MKQTLLKSLAFALVTSFCVSSASAQATSTKIVAFDLGKVFGDYYKVTEYSDLLKHVLENAQGDLKKDLEELRKLTDDINELAGKINKASENKTPDAEKAEMLNKYNQMVADARLKQDNYQQKLNNSQKRIDEAQTALRDQAVREINTAAANIAKDKKADLLVLDRNTVVFGENVRPTEITDEVIAALNKDKPKKSATTAAPSLLK